MIDKSLRKATAERCGKIIMISMTGGGDCLWLTMMLDTESWQMMCDSDIGSYSYRFNGSHVGQDFLKFCVEWFNSDKWLLRKCIEERHIKKQFDMDATVNALRKEYIEYNGEDCDSSDFERVLEIASEYSDCDRFAVALNVAANELYVELPEEWWSCLCEEYTAWQKRFAEICKEVIRPELMKLMEV